MYAIALKLKRSESETERLAMRSFKAGVKHPDLRGHLVDKKPRDKIEVYRCISKWKAIMRARMPLDRPRNLTVSAMECNTAGMSDLSLGLECNHTGEQPCAPRLKPSISNDVFANQITEVTEIMLKLQDKIESSNRVIQELKYKLQDRQPYNNSNFYRSDWRGNGRGNYRNNNYRNNNYRDNYRDNYHRDHFRGRDDYRNRNRRDDYRDRDNYRSRDHYSDDRRPSHQDYFYNKRQDHENRYSEQNPMPHHSTGAFHPGARPKPAAQHSLMDEREQFNSNQNSNTSYPPGQSVPFALDNAQAAIADGVYYNTSQAPSESALDTDQNTDEDAYYEELGQEFM